MPLAVHEVPKFAAKARNQLAAIRSGDDVARRILAEIPSGEAPGDQFGFAIPRRYHDLEELHFAARNLRQRLGDRETTPISAAIAIRKEIDSLTEIILDVRNQDIKRSFTSDRAYWKAVLPYVEAMT